MTQKIEQVIWMNPDELTPYPGNAKMHPADQIEHIANSIKSFGWTQPIVVDENNVVVIGHGRLMAAKELHLEKVPVVRRDDLTEEQINACRLADNKTNESPWDFVKLEEELAQLAIDGIDMSDFGFDSAEVTEVPEHLDDDGEEKMHVIASINFPNVDVYESVKDELQQIAEENGALLAVKMA